MQKKEIATLDQHNVIHACLSALGESTLNERPASLSLVFKESCRILAIWGLSKDIPMETIRSAAKIAAEKYLAEEL